LIDIVPQGIRLRCAQPWCRLAFVSTIDRQLAP